MKDDFPAKDARPWVPFREFIGNNPYLGFFRTNDLTVIVSRRPVCMLPNRYSHEGVQFFIALSSVRGGARDGRPVFVPGGFIYPVNGSQTHAVTEPIPRVSFISLYFRHAFFRKMCRVLRGSPEVRFENGLIPYDAELRGLMRAFFVEYGAGRRGNPNVGTDVMLDSIVTQLAVCLIRRLRFTAAATEGETDVETDMERVVEHLNENPTPCSLSEISELAHMNRFTALRKFREHTGTTPRKFQTVVRIHRAMDILKDPRCPIAEVGRLCGFVNPSHFARVFKKKTGFSPTEFRRKFLEMPLPSSPADSPNEKTSKNRTENGQ